MTSFSSFDESMMQRALELAQRGVFSTKPNPAVGCVITLNQHVLGEGWHHRAGEPHAEREALLHVQASGVDAEGSTVYVTLEPCSHFGRTPPCADALVAAKVARVVIAMQDPNPKVSGKGIQRLRDAGIRVDVGLYASEAERLNKGFCFAMRHQRPFVRLKTAISLDGRTALENGQSQWITGKEARLEGHRLRALSGAVITGIETVLADDPSLNVRLEDYVNSKQGLQSETVPPMRVVLDTRLRMPLNAKMLGLDGKTLIVTSEATFSSSPDKVSALKAAGAEVYALTLQPLEGQMSVRAVLQVLYEKFQVNQVLIEAGSAVSGEFLRQALVDEMHVFMAPKLLGSSAKPFALLPSLQAMSESLEYEFKDIAQVGKDLHLTLEPSHKRE